ncbi:MAG: hypothetical protein FJ255_04135 [Phycisphaerae bacterium]|nr:hypothetical protein [Phycisphaerae bacterium]
MAPRLLIALVGLTAVLSVPGLATAQPAYVHGVGERGEVPEWARRLAIDPSDPRLDEFKQMRRRQMEFEKRIKKVRFDSLRATNRPDVRAKGLATLNDLTDPAAFTPLVELLADQGPDVNQWLVGHFSSLKSDEADATLAWLALNSRDSELAADAGRALVGRVAQSGVISMRVQRVVVGALQSDADRIVLAGANLAETLGLWQMIPHLINAQVSQGSSADRQGPLAWILVGEQTAFVADLTPIVAPGAVAFDPQVATITTGTLLVIHDAVVTTVRFEVADVLHRMAARHVGSDTSRLGFDAGAWKRWHEEVFVPWARAQAADAPR